MKLEFIDLKRQYETYKNEIDARMQKVISNSAFIMGPEIKELEEALGKFVGTKHAISCASGTDALFLVLLAYGVGEGDEIITTPFTFIATSEVIALLKAKPVFVDIDPQTYNIDPTKIEKAITPRTKGIIAVNLFGQCADYDQINAVAKKHGLFVIEDAAQSFGSEYQGRRSCSLSDVGCTSFFPAKPLGCFGDGGMIFLNDDSKADVIRSLRVHGMGKDKYDNVRIGMNGRMDTLQAAVVLAKFAHYPQEIKDRQSKAQYYTQGLSKAVKTPHLKDGYTSVWAQYSVCSPRRDDLQKFLKDAAIPTAIHYPMPLHLQKAFAHLGYKKGDFPVSEKLSQEILALPMHPFLKNEEQDFIIGKIKEFS
ncbi:MAG: DegT/DnrJ/EryC1/StrS family aminotransferase [Candidatus Omnitrophica bacterium]|nr:DegT/DnrJ/EryC1/StrS family aminotransferase [Candidatus Omnitrophota bacterium]